MDLLAIADPRRMTLEPAQVIGITVCQLGNGEACVMPEIEAGRIEAGGLRCVLTGTNRLGAARGDLDRLAVVRALFHCRTIVRPDGLARNANHAR